MSFQELGLARKTEISEKFLDEFSKKDWLYFDVRWNDDLCKTWIIVEWHGQG